jgi:hypothetical protein
MSEGVADTLAALTTGNPEIAESVIPGQPFLRSIGPLTTFQDVAGAVDPHVIGLVYGNVNWTLAQSMGTSEFLQLMIRALPFLPSNPFEFEYRDAFLQADLIHNAGANQALLQSVFQAHDFDSVSPPPAFAGFLDDGVAEPGSLLDSPDTSNPNTALYIFFEFPGSQALVFNLVGSGTTPGDADLRVFPLSDLGKEKHSETPGTSNESVTINGVALPGEPSIDDDDAWLVEVADFPDGSPSVFDLTVTATLPAPTIVVDGPSVGGDLIENGEVDFFTFAGVQNQVVRLTATSGAPSLDPLVAVVNPSTFEVYGVDDDSGPGVDSLIQGAKLPQAGTYAVVVLSPAADVDPTIGTGPYTLALTTCVNTGTDTDGDGLVDACDDDDDDDGFIDSADLDPTDTMACADLDLDTCDDCSSGQPDILNDGPDSDSDAFCDAGDQDDDNDGCTDAVDPAPFSGSMDADLDFLGSDCDNCPNTANPGQQDTDKDGADGIGDVCDNCRFKANPNQLDRGGLNTTNPNNRGDECECGDVNGDGRITSGDPLTIQRSLLSPPAAVLTKPTLCNVDGSAACNAADALTMRRALLSPPSAVIQQTCPPALP